MIYINRNRHIENDEFRDMLSSFGLAEQLSVAQTVLIKPNLAAGTAADPNKHVISDLQFLANIIQTIAAINSKAAIYLAEGDSTGNGFAYLKFEHLNLPFSLDLEEDVLHRVQLLDLTRDRLVLKEDKRFLYFKSPDRPLWMSEKMMQADFIISMSNLKTHSVARFTGACKNLFGALPSFDKSIYHPHIHKVVHDVTLAIAPHLNIVDAFYAMQRNGPVQGEDIDLGFRVISDSAFEADCESAHQVGIRSTTIRYLQLLSRSLKSPLPVFEGKKARIKSPQLFLRIMNFIGLTLQRLGQSLVGFGHRIHTSTSPLILMIAIFRPLLTCMFSMDQLKRWKVKITKDEGL